MRVREYSWRFRRTRVSISVPGVPGLLSLLGALGAASAASAVGLAQPAPTQPAAPATGEHDSVLVAMVSVAQHVAHVMVWVSWALGAVVAIVAVLALVAEFSRRGMKRRLYEGMNQLARLSVSNLTGLAALLAGRGRLALRDEWRAHLAGESGHDPVTWRKVRQALGFVASAVQYRLADAADLAWRPADAVLCSRTLSNLFVWGPVALVLVAIVRHDGGFGLVADIQDPAALGAFLYGVIRTGRWYRDIKPPDPKARHARD